ncbi:MAG: DUF4256 domain-containing protein [Opitutaceae bacterium]
MKNPSGSKRELPAKQRTELLERLRARFEKNPHRHKGLAWEPVEAKLATAAGKLRSLNEMEQTGGEPDVVGHDKGTGEFLFVDCAPQSPEERASLCYDGDALDARKEHKPKGSVVEMAAAMGVELLTEEQYRELQKLEEFDTKSSSWVRTPSDVRRLGGALFCDRRFGRVFVYHNGAQSYYSGRGFRAMLRV